MSQSLKSGIVPEGLQRIANRMPGKLRENNFDVRTRRFFLVLAVMLGFLQAWASRMTLISDTVSYLDIGDAIWRGQWSMAVNGLWGPLFSVILGVTVGVFRPSLYWEYPLVHLVMFAIFLFALWGFDLFLRELISLRQTKEKGLAEELFVPTWVWMTIGYTIFLWSSLQLIEVSETNPDMLVAAFLYFACGFLVRMQRGTAGWRTCLSLGLVLGLGYLTKSVMFPVSLIFLAVAFGLYRRPVWRVAAAMAVFLIVSVPFIVVLSFHKGKITFGESGRYNYAVHVNHVPRTHWQGEIPGSGNPIHPTRQIFERPATFEFGDPLEGTYAAWTDPSYWYEGVQTRFDLHTAIRTEARLLKIEALFFFELHGSLIAALFVLFYVAGRKWSALNDISAYWFLLLPAASTLALYAMIHIEPRYVAPFIVVLILCLLFSVRLPASWESRRLYTGVAILLFLMFLCPIESPSLHVSDFARYLLGRSKPDPNSYQAMAGEMDQLGLKPGDRIASLGYSLYGMSTWARLSKVRIVAEVYYWPDLDESFGNDFWKADPTTQEKVIQAIAKTGARVIVSQEEPIPPDAPGWQRVGNTEYYAYWLRPVTQSFRNQYGVRWAIAGPVTP